MLAGRGWAQTAWIIPSIVLQTKGLSQMVQVTADAPDDQEEPTCSNGIKGWQLILTQTYKKHKTIQTGKLPANSVPALNASGEVGSGHGSQSSFTVGWIPR